MCQAAHHFRQTRCHRHLPAAHQSERAPAGMVVAHAESFSHTIPSWPAPSVKSWVIPAVACASPSACSGSCGKYACVSLLTACMCLDGTRPQSPWRTILLQSIADIKMMQHGSDLHSTCT